MVDDGIQGWGAFAAIFGIVLIFALFLRWRKRRQRDLTGPTQAAVKAQLASGIPADVRAEALALKKAGQFIEAVKLVRERTGCDLKTAKDTVDALR